MRAFEEVYADCDAALAAVDDCREAGLIRGKALVAQGKTEAAETHLESLLASYPNDEVLRYWHNKAAFEVCVCVCVCVCVPTLLALLVQTYKY